MSAFGFNPPHTFPRNNSSVGSPTPGYFAGHHPFPPPQYYGAPQYRPAAHLRSFVHVASRGNVDIAETIDPTLFVEEVPHYFLCCICHEVPLEPLEHAQNNCNVIVCKPCLNDYMANSVAEPQLSCPHCRRGSTHEFISMNRYLRTHYFETLEVICPETCCQKVVTVGTYLRHREQACEGCKVICPVQGCGFRCTRSQMAHHVNAMGIEHLEEIMKAYYDLSLKHGDNNQILHERPRSVDGRRRNV